MVEEHLERMGFTLRLTKLPHRDEPCLCWVDPNAMGIITTRNGKEVLFEVL